MAAVRIAGLVAALGALCSCDRSSGRSDPDAGDGRAGDSDRTPDPDPGTTPVDSGLTVDTGAAEGAVDPDVDTGPEGMPDAPPDAAAPPDVMPDVFVDFSLNIADAADAPGADLAPPPDLGPDVASDSPACPLGMGCDDGDPCTTGESCDVLGACSGGIPTDCSALDDTCHVGTCNPTTGQCESLPGNEGGSCEDGDLCTVGGTCDALGTCGGSSPTDCSALTDDCHAGSCNPGSGICEALPANVGGTCDDADLCTSGETCDALGACGGGAPTDCSAQDDACNVGTCNPASGACEPIAANEGGACNDGLYCSDPDTCTGGVCSGPPRDCSAVENNCTTGSTCDEGTDTCVPVNAPNGTACNDSLFCTNPDTCTGGACGGPPRDCSSVENQCTDGSTCNETSDVCVPIPKPNGTPCNDSDPCTEPDQCSGAACVGTPVHPIFAGAGQIASVGNDNDEVTATILDGLFPAGTPLCKGRVFALGDNAYENGLLQEFNDYYDPTWGRHKPRTHPIPGNHDFDQPNGQDYFTYFGAAAGVPGKGWYSFNLGQWHIVALNSVCDEVAGGGCDLGSEQNDWVRADLAADNHQCEIMMWHYPLFSSGCKNKPEVQPFWDIAYEFGVDVVLYSHVHNYERMALQNASGAPDPANGVRAFLAGTGGKSHDAWCTPEPDSEIKDGSTYGILKLTLHPGSYSWEFLPEPGETFTDSGTHNCH